MNLLNIKLFPSHRLVSEMDMIQFLRMLLCVVFGTEWMWIDIAHNHKVTQIRRVLRIVHWLISPANNHSINTTATTAQSTSPAQGLAFFCKLNVSSLTSNTMPPQLNIKLICITWHTNIRPWHKSSVDHTLIQILWHKVYLTLIKYLVYVIMIHCWRSS